MIRIVQQGSMPFRMKGESSIPPFQVLDPSLTFISTSFAVAVAKRARAARLAIMPTGIVEGFVPAATSDSLAASVGLAAANNHDNTINPDTNFKSGGLENLDENGNEVADKKYPKYAEIRAEARGRKGYKVRISEYLFTPMVDSNSYRL